ncbi:MAG: hypothetical protein ABSD68_03980 [Candidatus Micrarchaeales archaeon]|jgi:tRNA C32,U32 (ribose-2'-O)-methylase TrmJ
MGKENKVVRCLSSERFILIEPKQFNNADRIARTMAMCAGVKKVFLTSGDYGFVISAKEENEHGTEIISNKLLVHSLNSKAKVARGHFVYMRR